MWILSTGMYSTTLMCAGSAAALCSSGFYALRSEIDQFLKEKGRPLPKLSDPLCAGITANNEKYVSVMASLMIEFNQRFQDFSVIEKQIKLFSTPFLVDAEKVEKSLQLELIEMQCDDSLKSQHQLLSLPNFYQSLDNVKFPLIRRHAKRMMSLFGSTYICEQTFSLHLCEVLRVSTTKFSPDISAILRSKGQHHCSH
uniref:HAT C-terminal dimerisation domain-containing protein n=1 Tax=Periophthalmus magnuspinnatus TaxID=409849 RepID=A0A3B4B443_9GOBI